MIAETVKEVSPETLVVLDGVCAVASEEIQFDAWGIDVRLPLMFFLSLVVLTRGLSYRS